VADEDSIVMKTISVVKDIVGHGQGGLTYTSDQIRIGVGVRLELGSE
jgi:hypothetical protein